MTANSDTEQYPKTLLLQADQEQVEELGGMHGNGAKASLNDDTTGQNIVKYFYGKALGIEEFVTPPIQWVQAIVVICGTRAKLRYSVMLVSGMRIRWPSAPGQVANQTPRRSRSS